MRISAGLSCFGILLLVTSIPAQEEARLLRFPTIHGDQIAFAHAGNLYSVSASGGLARRLTTTTEGYQMFPRFSPDGKWIAFTGQYDGNTEVYLMPAEGGTPKRLTYTATLARDEISDRMGPNNIVIGWKHDGKHILFRTRMRSFNDFIGQLYTISVDGGLPEEVPVPRGGFASYSPDDSKMVYNRIFREFRTWKRYRGGLCDDIWIHDFNTHKTEAIAPNLASDIIPMWAGDKIYWISDRGEPERFNLYSYDLKTKDVKKLTDFKEFDIKFPSLGDKAIVFENGGWIYKFDLATEKAEKVLIRIRDDFSGARTTLKDVSKNIESYEISSDGKRALFVARGDVFTVPASKGPTRNLTNTSGVHERNAKWSPDGKTIAFISDATGEDEIHVMPQDGSDSPKPITSKADTYKYEIRFSPDSKKIGWSDKKERLQFVDVATKQVTVVAQSKEFEIRDWSWSPDSKWMAFVLPVRQGFDKIWLYSVDEKKSYPLTGEWYASSHPTFSGDGKYLFFVSARDFIPTYSQVEFNYSYANMQRIYFVTLQKETKNPFEPESDEVGEPAKPAPAKDDKKDEKKDDKKDQKKEDEKPKEDKSIKIDIDGIDRRIVRLPISPSSYRDLASVGNTVYYQRAGGFFLFDLGSKKETNLGNVDGYEISADGKKMLISVGGKYAIIDLPKGTVSVGEGMNLSGLEKRLDRHAEWKQIYNECWRQMRDFFYDPGMHGVDWEGVRKKYAPLLDHVHHRADLTFIIGEMIGELNAGHTYVGGGDEPKASRIPMGLLGAELKIDPTGYYKITKILKGANWDPLTRSPLTELGVNVKEGEFIVAVNGVPTNEMVNIYEHLINTVGKQVALKVNAKPEAKGARSVTVMPIGDESKLYYYDWVQGNIEKVSKATDGKVGYLHIPDMQVAGLNEFVKHFYPQLEKKALIVDERGNGGGNVSPMITERLRREIAMVGIARNSSPRVEPGGTFFGPMCCLLNEFSASDGDIFPYRFRYYKLGKLIGKRSWGGVIGIRGTLPLTDGGFLNKPEFSRYSLEDKWIMEGHGVDPDIVVDNDPYKEYTGTDEQLNKAIELMVEELKTKERNLPPVPPYPKK
ncbi:MAG TPA: PDZ domain-containing protein [Gemmataceae bacterium]|nr:PDZ domain-containing protein [Gemmataceae bacterium]